MRIDELFDKPQPLQWVDEGGIDKAAYFIVDGIKYQIAFVFTEATGGEDENGEIIGVLDDAVNVSFGIDGQNHSYFTRNNDASTGSKHKTIQIFSTVVAAIDTYFKETNTPVIHFRGSFFRQNKMYERMINFMVKRHPEYKVEEYYDSDEYGSEELYYEISR